MSKITGLQVSQEYKEKFTPRSFVVLPSTLALEIAHRMAEELAKTSASSCQEIIDGTLDSIRTTWKTTSADDTINFILVGYLSADIADKRNSLNNLNKPI